MYGARRAAQHPYQSGKHRQSMGGRGDQLPAGKRFFQNAVTGDRAAVCGAAGQGGHHAAGISGGAGIYPEAGQEGTGAGSRGQGSGEGKRGSELQPGEQRGERYRRGKGAGRAAGGRAVPGWRAGCVGQGGGRDALHGLCPDDLFQPERAAMRRSQRYCPDDGRYPVDRHVCRALPL